MGIGNFGLIICLYMFFGYQQQNYTKLLVLIVMKYEKRLGEKYSYSSIKLPSIQKHTRSHHSSKNKIKATQASIRSIESELSRNNSFSKQNVYNLNPKRYAKGKSKSRAEPPRLKTESIANQARKNLSPSHQTAQQLDNTLRQFQSKIDKNKQYILLQKSRKILGHKFSSNIISDSNPEHKQARRKSILFTNSNNGCAQIFDKINKIMAKNNPSSCQIDLQQVNKALKIADIKKNIKKQSPQKSLTKIKADILAQLSLQNSAKVEIKDEQNYSQWRRVSMNEKSVQYQKSTYENQNCRLNELTLKTEAAISKFLANKKILLHLKSKVLKTCQ